MTDKELSFFGANIPNDDLFGANIINISQMNSFLNPTPHYILSMCFFVLFPSLYELPTWQRKLLLPSSFPFLLKCQKVFLPHPHHIGFQNLFGLLKNQVRHIVLFLHATLHQPSPSISSLHMFFHPQQESSVYIPFYFLKLFSTSPR